MIALTYSKRVLMLCLAVLFFSNVQATHIFDYSRISESGGVPVVIGTTSDSTSVYSSFVLGKYYCPYNIKKNTDIITFGVDHNNPAFISDSSVISVKLIVRYPDNSTSVVRLKINNNPLRGNSNYIDKQTFIFNGQSHYSVAIDSIKINGIAKDTLPKYLYIDAGIDVQFDFIFDNYALTPLTTHLDSLDNDCDQINDEFNISWNFICGAEQYQLEWTFVNDYNHSVAPYEFISPDSLYYNFRNNSTRITTSNNNYKITNAFEHGWLLYRVRGLGVDNNDSSKTIYGVWSAPDNGKVSISDPSSKNHITQAHEGKMNWQYSASYAEEGKKKEVISYFDGSLRNRESVTKINSDTTVIVGQTIYDSQGRPAVNALPVPVVPQCTTAISPSIKFYEKFNQDDTNHLYARDDFDMDAGNCISAASGMSTASGASNYYSPANPNMKAQQAFLPDAHKYPFSQIQYTPDNTGRISKQSGVGPEFQIGSNHETKYYYSQPNQIQLDRMFGSEVGDAGHYKLNLVFDANGQASISYLDQEGRVIATSLAGNSPKSMDSLSNITNAQQNLTVDMFAKDSSGHSSTNTIGIGNDSITFNTQLMVAYNSNYKFDYNLTVDTMSTHCLCFNCIYDLSIKVTSECGDSVSDIFGSRAYAHRYKVGHFSPGGTFSNDCSPAQYSKIDSFTLFLTPGNYTISKVLTIDKNARDYFIKEYLDSANKCVLPKSHFINAALANADTIDCSISCDSCAKALGDRNQWVASGKGTALQYDKLYEDCGKPCRPITICEATYNQLLSDVSLGGQYAQYYVEDTTINYIVPTPQNFLLSVLNSSNRLPIHKFIPASHPNWQYPMAKINGYEHYCYMEDNGDTSKVIIEPVNGSYYPSVDYPINVHYSGGVYYVYPEHLDSVKDFIHAWEPSWAISLVQYHPEYSYYETCNQYSVDQKSNSSTTDTRSSDDFDNLLYNTKTFKTALDSGLISNSNKLPVDYANSSSWPYDPFAHDDFYYGTALPNIQNTLVSKFNYYPDINSSYTMYQIAAIAVRCGNQFGMTPVTSCSDFGSNFINSPSNHRDSIYNDSIKNSEWNIFKDIYLAEKHKLQQNRADDIALTIDSTGYNGCIGNENFDPVASGMFKTQGPWMPWNWSMYWLTHHVPFFDPAQPCNDLYYQLYTDKIKRFSSPDDLTMPDPGYQTYLQTGQCPLAFELQGLLSGMASSHYMAGGTNENLQYHAEFTRDLYTEINGGTLPATYIPYSWYVLGTPTDIVTVQIKNGSTVACTIVLDKNGAGINSWNDIFGFKDLTYTTKSGGNYNFSVYAMLANNSGASTPYTFKLITGTTCINIASCNFQNQCAANQLAHDMSKLWTALAINGDMGYSSNIVSLQNTFYKPFKTTTIINALGVADTSLQWKYNSSDSLFEISDSTINSQKLLIRFSNFKPPTYYISNFLDSIVGFINITGDNQDGFIVEGVDKRGIVIDTITGNVKKFITSSNYSQTVIMSECGTSTPMDCQGPEYQLSDDLGAYVYDLFMNKPHPTGFQITQSPEFTSLIESHMPYGLTGSSYQTVDWQQNGQYIETWNLNYFNTTDTCHIKLYSRNPLDTLPFKNLTYLGDIKPYGAISGNNNYNSFYMLASFNIKGMHYNDTIFGESSCLPLMFCPCPVITKTDINNCREKGQVPYESCWLISSLTAFNFLSSSTVINAVIANTENPIFHTPSQYEIDTSYQKMHGAQWYSLDSAGIWHGAYSYYLYRKIFEVSNNASSLDIELMPYSIAYVIINHTLVDSIKNNLSIASLKLQGYGQYLHTGLDTLQVIIQPIKIVSINALGVKGNIIEIQPCSPPVDTFYSPPFTPGKSPCVEYMENIAVENGQLAYNEYRDSIITSLSAAYTKHCLGALENFTYNYFDKEYHFTLYYYDQAGNLIKTIPPEGIDLLNVNWSTNPNSTDPAFLLEKKIIADRSSNTHSIFTNHRMETRYEYNSLNQLVKQVMPDHDKMNIWDYTLPNGLDRRLQITSTQFVNSTTGYLTGYLNPGNGRMRGYLYSSNDAGATWTKAVGMVAADLKKVQMIQGTYTGYAIGNGGIILKTTDKGLNWDMTTLYPMGITANLNALCFTDSTHGIIAGNNGKVLYTNDGGSTFATVSGIIPTDTITSVTNDGTNYYASAIDASGLGKIYKSSASSVLHWIEHDSLTSNDLVKVRHIVTLNKWYAAGVDGSLLSSNDGEIWKTIPTGTSGSFKDIWFYTANYGVAIIANNSNIGQIWKTIDGGKTWTLLSLPSDAYNAFYFYDNTHGLGYAVGDHGLIKRIVFVNTIGAGQLVDITTPDPSSMRTLYAVNASGDGKKIWVAANNNTVYYCTNGMASNVTWNTPTGGINLKDIYYSYANNVGLGLTRKGDVFKITPSGISAFTTAPPAITHMDTTNNELVAYDSTNAVIKYILISNLSSATSFNSTLNNVPSPVAANVLSLAIHNDTIITTGMNGDIYKGVFNTSNISWKNESRKVQPVALNDIKYAGGTTLYAVGNDGTILQTSDSANWKTLTSGTAAKLNAVSPYSANSGLVAGNAGYFGKFSSSGNLSNLSKINIGTTKNLNNIAISSNHKAYLSGNVGTIIYIHDYTASTISDTILPITAGTTNFYGIAFNGSSNAVAVGSSGMIYNLAITSGVKNKNVYTPGLREANFLTANEGYVIGTSGTIRHTSDGGSTWNIVPPTITSNTTPYLNGVWTTQAGKAVLVGGSGYWANISGNTITYAYTAGTSGDSLKDVAINPGGIGFIVGSNEIYRTHDYGLSWTQIATGYSLNALHLFADNTFIAVGNNAAVCTWDGANITNSGKNNSIAPNAKLQNVFFSDDRNGYTVGNAGLLYKCSCINNASIAGTQITWIPKPTRDAFDISDSTKVNIKCIDFPSRYNGFIAGMFNPSSTTHNYAYARLLHDESMMYSRLYYYDRLGRLVVSQNTKQFNKTPKTYSYTRYDDLGRIIESGEKAENSNGSGNNKKFANVFGTYVNNKFNPKAINDDSLKAWMTNPTGARTEVTRSFYDVPIITNFVQDNLRNRVATVTYSDTYNSDSTAYNYATHYSYDVHGNVKTLWTDNPPLAAISSQLTGQRFKRIDYDYDLVSGKVNEVYYQHDSLDAFAHHYEYDADNKLTQVYTSKYPDVVWTGVQGDPFWDNDAKYFYYKHGPLARVELGNDKVQGIDYAYTLQGWVKGVNSETIDSTRDMGQDGNPVTGNNNTNFAKDVFGYSLNYYSGDYSAIGGTGSNSFMASKANLVNLSTYAPGLYNGNISSMVTSITNPTTGKALPQLTAYKYDQLNRIKQMKAFADINFTNNAWNGSGWTDKYKNTFSYDANGNIDSLKRYDSLGNMFDNLTYDYLKDASGNLMQNRLYNVNDNATRLASKEDIADQGTFNPAASEVNIKNNYNYDEIGELKKDSAEGIKDIEWTVYGKVKSITRRDGFKDTVNGQIIYPSDLEFLYNPTGNRIAKIEKTRDANGLKPATEWKTTYYIKDVNGSEIAVYKYYYQNTQGHFKLIEQPMYGRDKLGTDYDTIELISPSPQGAIFTKVLGNKQYALENHLGSVLATVSDRKIQHPNNTDTIVGYYTADIRSAQDYYAYGFIEKGRSFSSNKYRFGHNGQEKDDEIAGITGANYTAEYWEYDSRTGRRWNNDNYSSASVSPYACFGDNPIYFTDYYGNWPWPYLLKGLTFSKTSSHFGGFGGRTYTNKYGKLVSDFHPGIDEATWVPSTAILSAARGTVFRVGANPGGYGNFIIIDHGNGYYTLYGHMKASDILVKEGQEVTNGQAIAYVGSEGASTGPHLHFGIYQSAGGSAVTHDNFFVAGVVTAIDPTSIYDLNEFLHPDDVANTITLKTLEVTAKAVSDYSTKIVPKIPQIEMPKAEIVMPDLYKNKTGASSNQAGTSTNNNSSNDNSTPSNNNDNSGSPSSGNTTPPPRNKNVPLY
jgi:murein DD-endopeptidase MepM/ murein hydrolase activator NlpD/photosystem II stability/assembly factor-like uncharacterized protein